MFLIIKKYIRKIRSLFGYTPEVLEYKFHYRRRHQLINDYFDNNEVKKIHIGCQRHIIKGWLNTDIEPKSLDVLLMDTSKKFPFPNDSFDYVFSEHMIEHISLEASIFMIKECFRILKPNGKIRIATPDLNFLINLYNFNKTTIQKEYVEYNKKFLQVKMPIMDTFVINNFFYSFGHKFIHDEKSLRFLFENAGFREIIKREIHKSEDLVLSKLENHGKEITDKFNELETIVFEAKK